MNGVYFLHQIKHKTSGTWDKGIVVKDQGTDTENLEAAKQGYHAYLGAYAYGHDSATDYVACYVTDMDGVRILWEIWDGTAEPEPEPEPEE